MFSNPGRDLALGGTWSRWPMGRGNPRRTAQGGVLGRTEEGIAVPTTAGLRLSMPPDLSLCIAGSLYPRPMHEEVTVKIEGGVQNAKGHIRLP
jgi:hypothetical protein